MAIDTILSAQIDDPLGWKQAYLPIGKARRWHLVQDHAPDERNRVRPHVRRQQRGQQGAPPISARRLGVRVLHRLVATLSQLHPAIAPLPACRLVPAGLEDMPSHPLPEVPSTHDGLVRRPRRDLQARAAHHSPPGPHAVRAEHHCQ
ncbi:unnamed protein product [Sphagnum jensenii]|uniref:Uncharacterized protein n=1 Tax=Sphagnum jensenii TaxID=128206 RepID=A0ABP0WPG9_9BRYO